MDSGPRVRHAERVELEWTELGKRQLRKLADSLRPFEERKIETRGGKHTLRCLWHRWKIIYALRLHGWDLKVWRLPYAKELALIALLASEALKLSERGEL